MNYVGIIRNWDWDFIWFIDIDVNYKLYVCYDNICLLLRRDINVYKKREELFLVEGDFEW